MGGWIISWVLFFLSVLQSEPFNGQGSIPSGGAGGYNAFTQAAVSGVSHTWTHLSLVWKESSSAWWWTLPEMLRSSKHSSSSSSLSQVGAEWCLDIPAHRWEGIPRPRWHLGRPYLPTCPQARTQNPPTSHRTSNPTSAPSSPLQVRLAAVNTHQNARSEVRRYLVSVFAFRQFSET